MIQTLRQTLMLCAALAAVAFDPTTTLSAVIWSCDFEAPMYSLGPVGGQGLPPFQVPINTYVFNVTDTPGAAHGGSRFARVAAADTSSTGTWTWVFVRRDPQALLRGGTIIRVSAWMQVHTPGTAGTRVYYADLIAMDQFQVTPIASFTLNSHGALTARNGAGASAAAGTLSLNEWHRFEIEIDFQLKTVAYRVDDVALALPAKMKILDPSIVSFGELDLSAHSSSGTSSAVELRFDDLRIEQLRHACPADADGSGVVDDADFALFAFAYNLLLCDDADMPIGCPLDFNADGVVDDADFQSFIRAYDFHYCP